MTSTIVPPVDLAPGMPSRVVTISATDVTEGGKSLEGQMVRFALSDTLDVSSGGDVIAKTQAEVVLDSNGEGRIRLPVYDEDVKTWCGKDWAILVTATWGSQKAIRVPAGSSSIALSALPAVRPLRGRELQWAITGAAVTVTQGATAGGTVTLNGGVLDFVLTLPDTNPGTLAAARAYADQLTAPLQTGKNLWNPAAVRDGQYLWHRAETDPYVDSANFMSSGPILVSAGQQITVWGLGAPGYPAQVGPHMWVFYDMADEFIEFGQDPDMAVRTVTAPQDGFLRVAFRKAAVADPMIEAGPVPTEHEPYRLRIPGLALDLSPLDLPAGVVTPEKTSFAVAGKNLLDPAAFEPGSLLALGVLVEAPAYTTSGFFSVTPGAEYTGVVRVWSWYTASGGLISEWNTGDNYTATTQTAPDNAVLARVSWHSSLDAVAQVEAGTAPTEYEAYGVRIPGLLDAGGGGGTPASAGPVTATLTGDALAVRTSLGGDLLTVTTSLHGSANGGFNFLGATLAGAPVSTGADDIAPLRTFNTVGANHGYTAITRLTAPGHGKTGADLGSVWSDGVRQWTLLLIDGDQLTLGPEYVVTDGVVTASGEAPSGPLTHVSGATSTTDIPVDQVVAGAQLYPSVQRVIVTPLVDGRVIGEGEHQGVEAQIREVYDVLDYASIIDTARANVGTPFHERRVDGAVRVENVYTFRPGVVLVDTALTELAPTVLGSCGFVQAVRPSGTGGRIVPGVTGWTSPRSFADTWASEVITTSDLIDPTIPPVMSLDVMDWGGFALGYMPHAPGVTSSVERIEHGSSRLWDLRSTQKSYPSPWASRPAGWGRVEAHAYRAYLTPAQAGEVAAVAEDAHAAHSALATLTGL